MRNLPFATRHECDSHPAYKINDEKNQQNGSKQSATDIHVALRLRRWFRIRQQPDGPRPFAITQSAGDVGALGTRCMPCGYDLESQTVIAMGFQLAGAKVVGF